MGGLSGYFAGGMARGMSSGLRSVTEMRAADEMSARTDIMRKEEERRAAEEGRKVEDYNRGNEQVPIEAAEKLYPDPVEAEYVKNFARSLGAVRKNADGTEYVLRKDALKVAEMIRNPETQKDIADHKVNVYGEKVAAAEQRVRDNEYDERAVKELADLKRAYATARARHPGLVAFDREKEKEARETAVLPPGSTLVKKQGGEVIAKGGDKEATTVDQQALEDIRKTGKVSEATKELIRLKKEHPASNDTSLTKEHGRIAAKVSRLGIESLTPGEQTVWKTMTEGKVKTQDDYARQDRLDKEYQTKIDKLDKQYEEDVVEMTEAEATKKYNRQMVELRKNYAPRYANLGLNLDGSPLETPAKKLPQKSGEPLSPKKMPGKTGEQVKPKNLMQYEAIRKADGSTVARFPDGTERPINIDEKTGKMTWR